MSDQDQVVLRYRDGHTERVGLEPFDPQREVVVVRRDDGAGEVPFSLLKAVFFPRVTPDEKLEAPSGSTIAVEFTDGEVIRGIANYNPERNGFFLVPHDRSKNERIFVVNSAISSIEVEKL
ncbi:MAG: DUF6982 domain-containing protein [Thermoanaerobaculia bacterium]